MFTTSGSVLGSLLFARKRVIVPEGILYQSSWRTPRRLSSLSVYLIMVEYICQYQEKQKRVCFLEAMLIKIVAIFHVCIIISSVHIRVEHSILRAPKSTSRSHFLCTTWVPACPNSESVSNLQRGDLLKECSFGLFGVQFDEQEQEQLSFSRNYQCEWSKKRLHFSPIVVIISSHRLKSPPPSA